MSWSAELELKKPWYDPAIGEEIENWVLCDWFDEDGDVRTIMGSVTDITLQKRSAKDAEARAQLSEQLLQHTQEAEALQSSDSRKPRSPDASRTLLTYHCSKLLQAQIRWNSIINVSSCSEMRNPLSAIGAIENFPWIGRV